MAIALFKHNQDAYTVAFQMLQANGIALGRTDRAAAILPQEWHPKHLRTTGTLSTIGITPQKEDSETS